MSSLIGHRLVMLDLRNIVSTSRVGNLMRNMRVTRRGSGRLLIMNVSYGLLMLVWRVLCLIRMRVLWLMDLILLIVFRLFRLRPSWVSRRRRLNLLNLRCRLRAIPR